MTLNCLFSPSLLVLRWDKYRHYIAAVVNLDMTTDQYKTVALAGFVKAAGSFHSWSEGWEEEQELIRSISVRGCQVWWGTDLYCTVLYCTILYGIVLTKLDCLILYIKHDICLKIDFFLHKSVLSPQILVLLRQKNILCTKIYFA